MDELDKETNETHNEKAGADSSGNHGEFLSVRLGALFDQMHRITGKLLQWLNEHFVDSFFVGHFDALEEKK